LATSESRRLVSLALVVVLALAFMAPAACAAPVPSQTTCSASATVEQQAVAAERDLVKGKLMDFGLSDEDAASRVELLTDEEVHAIAADLDSLKAAGAMSDDRWDTVTVLLLLILVAILAS
jgi:hypothetical protein